MVSVPERPVSTTHPLDPLSADEIAEAVSILRAGPTLGPRTRLVSVSLREPTRQEIRQHRQGTVLEREAPGIVQAIRADSIAKTPHGLLSRGLAGVVGRTLVVNLPGSTGGCRDGFAVLRPALAHALELLADAPTEHEQT